MWPFGKKADLVGLVGNLAFYNDKGYIYAGHDEQRV
jgi:hypothetical protein